MKQNLYEISTDFIELINDIEIAGGEITPETEAALEINKESLEKKAIGYKEVIDIKEAYNKRIDEEIKRLQALKKRNSAITYRLKESLLNAIKLFGEFEVGFHKFGTRKSSTLLVTDATLVPNEYKVRTVTESIQKNEVKKAIKDGVKIDGAEIVENINLKVT